MFRTKGKKKKQAKQKKGGRGQINIYPDTSCYVKSGPWLQESPFPEVVSIHQMLNSSIDSGWLSCAPRTTPGLQDKGTTALTSLDGSELAFTEPHRNLCCLGIYCLKAGVGDVAIPLTCPVSIEPAAGKPDCRGADPGQEWR